MKGFVRVASAVLAMLLVLWSACAELGTDPAPGAGRIHGTLTAPNGLMFNGLAPNGLMFNGLMFNGLMFNGATLEGLALDQATLDGAPLDSAQEQELIDVLAYAAECALSEDQSAVVVASDGTPILYRGALGLAPEWRDGPLSAEGQRRVSACLAARANALAQTVIISLRVPDLPVSQQERDVFSTHEGAFWGDLFTENAHIYACVAEGGGLAGRVCAQSDACGFTFVGDCDDVCTFDENLDQYTSCQAPHSPAPETHVVNTFLSLGRRVTYGDSNICVIQEDGGQDHGTIACWGDNTFGQLADGTTEPSQTPVAVPALGNDNAEVAASLHVCVRKHDGRLFCWGRNHEGQVGNGVVDDQHLPAYITGNVAEVALGRQHTCARKADSSVWCWGDNRDGQVGTGQPAPRLTTPQQVPNLHATRLSSATNARHTCAIDLDGSLWCWGRNSRGQLGDGAMRRRTLPVQVSEDEHGWAFGDVTDVCTGRDLTCARTADGGAWCWGQTGGVQRARPRQLAFADTGLAAAPAGLSCGASFACFVATNGTVWCLGDNQYGQLGHDTGGAATDSLHRVRNLEGATFVNAARTHTCSTRVDGTVLCWGTDPGRTGGLPVEPLFPGVELTLDPVPIPLP